MVSIRCNLPVVAGLLAACCAISGPAAAQGLGSRAAGMGDAFVAVADDATSVYWNPAGMATGAYFSFVIDLLDAGLDPGAPAASPGAVARDARFIGFTVPALGVAYFRRSVAVAEPAGPAVPGGAGREEGRRRVRALATSGLGLTLAQSIGEAVVVGGTLQWLRGSVSRGIVTSASDDAALEAADGLPVRGTTRFGVDAGVMATLDRWRVGLVARNLTTPSFAGVEPDGPAVELAREVRAGVAWGSGWPGFGRLVLSADADLTRRRTLGDERRDVAAGAETWWLGQRLAVRGGIRASTAGEARPVATAGLSAAIRPGAFVEGHVARGARDEHAWSIGARLTF